MMKVVMDRIKIQNEIHLEETAILTKELGIAGVGSAFELGHISTIGGNEDKLSGFILAIHRLWGDAGSTYRVRRFNACTVLLGVLAETVLCMELTKRGVNYDEKWSLGQLKDYCAGKTMNKKMIISGEVKEFFSSIIDDLSSLVKLRNEAAHSSACNEELSELIPFEYFKIPPVQISDKGISGDDLELVIISTNNLPRYFIKYPFKRGAKKAYFHTQNILKRLYNLEFIFGANWDKPPLGG